MFKVNDNVNTGPRAGEYSGQVRKENDCEWNMYKDSMDIFL